LAAGHHEPWYHPQSRPLECEAEAIARMINLAGLAGNAPLYIVHLSNGLGLEYLKLARRQGQPVWVETCPQYLLLDDSCYYREDGVDYLLSPPLRSRREQDKLWVGVAAGDIDTVATDHCNFSHAQRMTLSGGDFSRCPNGLPGVENRMLLLFAHGVLGGRISPSRFVALTSTNSVRLFGLWPRKGNLQPGADADLVLMDPRGETQIRHAALHDQARGHLLARGHGQRGAVQRIRQRLLHLGQRPARLGVLGQRGRVAHHGDLDLQQLLAEGLVAHARLAGHHQQARAFVVAHLGAAPDVHAGGRHGAREVQRQRLHERLPPGRAAHAPLARVSA
jgi:hypothetical protein